MDGSEEHPWYCSCIERSKRALVVNYLLTSLGPNDDESP